MDCSVDWHSYANVFAANWLQGKEVFWRPVFAGVKVLILFGRASRHGVRYFVRAAVRCLFRPGGKFSRKAEQEEEDTVPEPLAWGLTWQ